jgi:CRP-like cAMP-binding protein
MVTIENLKKTDTFKTLDDSQLKGLASIAKRESHSAGTMLFKQGEDASNFFIIEEGSVLLQMDVDMGSDRRSVKLDAAVITQGHSIGWSVFAEPHRYTLNARCLDNVKVISFNADQFKSLLDQNPELGYEVMKGIVRMLATRLSNTRELLFDEEVMAQLRDKGETLL